MKEAFAILLILLVVSLCGIAALHGSGMGKREIEEEDAVRRSRELGLKVKGDGGRNGTV